MTYSACDFADDAISALAIPVPEDNGDDCLPEQAAAALAEIDRLHRVEAQAQAMLRVLTAIKRRSCSRPVSGALSSVFGMADTAIAAAEAAGIKVEG